MDAVDLRYSAWAKARDLYIASLIAFVPGALVHAALVAGKFLPGPTAAGLFACWAAAWGPCALVAGLWRWGRRGRMDVLGVAYAESRRGPVRQLAWADVQEIRCLGRTGVELGAGETRIPFGDDFVPMGEAWRHAGRCRGHALRAELQRRFSAGETLRFRGPLSPEAALARAVAVIAASAPVLYWLGSVLLHGWRTYGETSFAELELGVGGLFFAAVGAVAVGLLLRIRARCGWVELGPAGLTARGATRTVCSWEDLRAMGIPDRDGLRFRRADGVSFRIPRDVANFMFLEELIRERKER